VGVDLPDHEGWVIYTDAQLTRRKRYHCIVSPKNAFTFKSKDLWDCIEWLAAEEIDEYQLRPMMQQKGQALRRVSVNGALLQWQN